MTILQDTPKSAGVDSNYLLSYDDSEKARLSLQHDLILSYMGQLILAPIDTSRRGLKIIDSATFDGHWLQEVSRQLGPSPTLVGADISAEAFPDTATTQSSPPVTYLTQSVTSPWPAAHHGSYDLVHQRLVLAGTTPQQGLEAVRGLAALARPGTGWVQLIEGTFDHLNAAEGDSEELKQQYAARFPALARFQRMVAAILPSLGWNAHAGLQVPGWLSAVGLVDVQEKVMVIPVGVANADPQLGAMAKRNWVEVVNNFAEVVKGTAGSQGISVEEATEIARDLLYEIETVGSLLRFNAVWGRRP